MSIKSDLAESIRREKARNMRYKKAIHTDLNLESINSSLYDIWESTSNILYWFDSDDGTQLDALIGDEEETFELRLAFSTLEADCEQLLQDLAAGQMIGFDPYEGDYFGLSCYEDEWAKRECTERLMRHTKAEIIEAYAICFRVAVSYMALSSRYDGLKSYIDILNGQNTGFLAAVKRIEELYERTSCNSPQYQDKMEFDRLLDSMPPEVWLQ